MSIYIVETEITDYLIKSVKEDAVEFTTFINTYLDRADKWYIERAEYFGIEESSIPTYTDGMKNSVVKMLRLYTYIEALTDLKSNGIVSTDDYNSKLYGVGGNDDAGYLTKFENLENSLTYEKILNLAPKIDPTLRTGQRVTLQADLYNTTSTESEF